MGPHTPLPFLTSLSMSKVMPSDKQWEGTPFEAPDTKGQLIGKDPDAGKD